MKVYSKNFNNYVKESAIGDYISHVKVKKNGEYYDITVSVDSLDVSLYDIRDSIEEVNRVHYNDKINIGKMLIEI